MIHIIRNKRGFSLMELLVVLGILGVLLLIGIPNFYNIMIGHRLRSSANDLLAKARWVRRVAIAKRRQLDMTINKDDHTMTVEKPAHTEYDLLKDIAKAISTSSVAYPNLSSFILYEEGSESLETFCIGGSDDFADRPCLQRKKGYDEMDSSCPSYTISFHPSGMLSATCEITITNTDKGGVYTLKLYRGGQIILR